MRTTLDIDVDLLQKAMAAAGTASKKQTVEMALEELLRARLRRQLCRLIGNNDGFDLTLEKLERMRSEP